MVTTLLCCGWGLSFACSFFRCALDGSGPLVCVAAALPLAAVWASLERKRWGRLVLIGQSLLAQALFALILSILAFSNHVQMEPAERHFFGYLNYALHLFGETKETTLVVLLLSAATTVWFFLPWVQAEFELSKKPFLTPGQRVIAATVVSVWCLTMIATPTRPESRSPNIPLKTPRRLTLRY
jgi:hypothetical protein